MPRVGRFSSRTMKAADWRELRHFTPEEFKTPDKMGLEFMRWLDELRDRVGMPMTVTSSYRSPAYNKSVGGAADSSHADPICNAVDIGKRPRPDDPNWNHTRALIIFTAHDMGCDRIGFYRNGSLHLDRTEDVRPTPRVWNAVDNPA